MGSNFSSVNDKQSLRFSAILRFSRSQKLLLARKFICTHKYGYFINRTDTSGSFVVCALFLILNGLIYIPTLSVCILSSMLISHVLVTSRLDSVCGIIAFYVNFIQKYLHEHEMHLPDYNV